MKWKQWCGVPHTRGTSPRGCCPGLTFIPYPHPYLTPGQWAPAQHVASFLQKRWMSFRARGPRKLQAPIWSCLFLSASSRATPQASSSGVPTFIPVVPCQVTLLSVEMTALKEERDRLRVTSEDQEPKEQLQKAIRDRDEAIAK